MDKKTEFDSRWNDLSKRLKNDHKFDDVMKSFEDTSIVDDASEGHSRLKVPYASTSPVDTNDVRWK